MWINFAELAPLSPKYDVVFKGIFGEEHNVHVLSDFLQVVLEPSAGKYEDIRLLDPHLLRKHKRDKLGILDLRVATKSGETIHVELQVSPSPFIWRRIEYYNAKLMANQIGVGDDYDRINRVVTILISYHDLVRETTEFLSKFIWFDPRTNVRYPGSSEINILEVQKAKNFIKKAGNVESSPLLNWLLFFASETKEEFEMAAQTRQAIDDAWGVVQLLSASEEARLLAEYEEKARRDEAARQKEARREGKEEGIREVARNLLREKMSVESVIKFTGLPFEEVKQLAEKMEG